jgi:hypothetical protein
MSRALAMVPSVSFFRYKALFRLLRAELHSD